jgi:hypothetical protein
MSSVDTVSSSLHRQAMAYAKLAESPTVRSTANVTNSSATISTADKGEDDVGLLTVLPISAQSAGLLPKCTSGTQYVHHNSSAPIQLRKHKKEMKGKKKRNGRG